MVKVSRREGDKEDTRILFPLRRPSSHLPGKPSVSPVREPKTNHHLLSPTCIKYCINVLGPWESKVNAVILRIPSQFIPFSAARDTEQTVYAHRIGKMPIALQGFPWNRSAITFLFQYLTTDCLSIPAVCFICHVSEQFGIIETTNQLKLKSIILVKALQFL